MAAPCNGERTLKGACTVGRAAISRRARQRTQRGGELDGGERVFASKSIRFCRRVPRCRAGSLCFSAARRGRRWLRSCASAPAPAPAPPGFGAAGTANAPPRGGGGRPRGPRPELLPPVRRVRDVPFGVSTRAGRTRYEPRYPVARPHRPISAMNPRSAGRRGSAHRDPYTLLPRYPRVPRARVRAGPAGRVRACGCAPRSTEHGSARCRWSLGSGASGTRVTTRVTKSSLKSLTSSYYPLAASDDHLDTILARRGCPVHCRRRNKASEAWKQARRTCAHRCPARRSGHEVEAWKRGFSHRPWKRPMECSRQRSRQRRRRTCVRATAHSTAHSCWGWLEVYHRRWQRWRRGRHTHWHSDGFASEWVLHSGAVFAFLPMPPA